MYRHFKNYGFKIYTSPLLGIFDIYKRSGLLEITFPTGEKGFPLIKNALSDVSMFLFIIPINAGVCEACVTVSVAAMAVYGFSPI